MSPSKEATRRSRRVFTPEQKATILRRHLGDKVPVSNLCDEYQLAPSLFYLWQKQSSRAIDRGAARWPDVARRVADGECGSRAHCRARRDDCEGRPPHRGRVGRISGLE